MTGSDVSFCCHTLNACIASRGSGPFLYPEYLCVTLKSGTATITKSFMCEQMKLNSPTKDLTFLMFIGG